jgi:hypothetical protein
LFCRCPNFLLSLPLPAALCGLAGHQLVIISSQAHTAGMVSGRKCGRLVAAGLAAAWIAGSAGCTSVNGAPHGQAATSVGPVSRRPAVQPCGKRQIRSAVERFFAAWNHRERRSFGQLFRGHGELDMATKHQDTLHHHAWSSAVGPGQVTAFATRQWLLGEVLSHDGMTIYRGPFGPGYLGGAEVNVAAARFADGTMQPIEEAKFNYNCAAGAFAYVVIISDGTAAKT